MSQIHIAPALFNKLPALPQTLVQLIEACNDEQRNLSEIGKIVASEPTIAGRVLQLANSAFLGARSRFSSIEQAAIFLGIETVRNLAISVSVHEAFSHTPASSHFRLEHFWYHSLLTALLAKELATRFNHPKPAAAYLCGLLHDLGKLVLLDCDSDRYQQLFTQTGRDMSLTTLEEETFGTNHAEVSAHLLRHWQLEELVIEPVQNHHRRWDAGTAAPDLGLITSLANRLAQPAPDWNDLTSQLSACGLERSQIEQLLTDLHQQVDTLAAAFGISARQAPVADNAPAAKHLQATLFDLSRLAAVHERLILAMGVEEICQAMEESLLIHFAIDRMILLLPEDEVWQAHGSARNAQREKMQNLAPEKLHGQLLKQLLDQPGLQTIQEGQATSPLHKELLQIFASQALHSLSFSWTSRRRGLLFFTTTSDQPSDEQVKALRLLLGAGASRLRLEMIQERRAEDLASLKAETLQQTASCIAHEIATPLNTLTNFLELLSRNKTLDQALAADLSLVQGELERLAVLSQGFNNLSIPAGQRNRQPVDLRQLVEQQVRLYLRHPLVQKKIQLRSLVDDDLPLVLSDSGSLKQILGNLLQNSIEAIETEHGQITLQVSKASCKKTGKGVILISVIDNGSGLDRAFTSTLLHPGNSGKGHGHAGLGLSIASKLAHNIGATLSWESDRQGHTVFSLAIPAESSCQD